MIGLLGSVRVNGVEPPYARRHLRLIVLGARPSDRPIARKLSPEARRCCISTRSSSLSSLYVLIATAYVRSGKVLHVEFEPAPEFFSSR